MQRSTKIGLAVLGAAAVAGWWIARRGESSPSELPGPTPPVSPEREATPARSQPPAGQGGILPGEWSGETETGDWDVSGETTVPGKAPPTGPVDLDPLAWPFIFGYLK